MKVLGNCVQMLEHLGRRQKCSDCFLNLFKLVTIQGYFSISVMGCGDLKQTWAAG